MQLTELRPYFVISEAHSTQLALRTTDLEESSVATSQGDFENERSPEQPNNEADPSSTYPNPSPSTNCNPSPSQTSQPPMRSVKRPETALHRCCGMEVTAAGITYGSTVVQCPRLGLRDGLDQSTNTSTLTTNTHSH